MSGPPIEILQNIIFRELIFPWPGRRVVTKIVANLKKSVFFYLLMNIDEVIVNEMLMKAKKIRKKNGL